MCPRATASCRRVHPGALGLSSPFPRRYFNSKCCLFDFNRRISLLTPHPQTNVQRQAFSPLRLPCAHRVPMIRSYSGLRLPGLLVSREKDNPGFSGLHPAGRWPSNASPEATASRRHLSRAIERAPGSSMPLAHSHSREFYICGRNKI